MKNWMLILTVLASIATLGLIGYFVYEKFFVKKGITTCDECKKAGGTCKFILDGANSQYDGCHLPKVPVLPTKI